MTISVANVTVANTFSNWLTVTNQIADALTNKIVTVNSNTAVGNAQISGTFTFGNSSANATVNATTISISNTTANINILVPTATQIANNQFYLNANGSWTTAGPTVSSVLTTGTSTQVIDYFSMASFNAAEYLVNVSDNTGNVNFYTSKILVSHNRSTSLVTEYAAINSTSTSLGVFSSSTNATHVILNFTPVPANTTVKFTKVII
jgi:hypothetical protein